MISVKSFPSFHLMGTLVDVIRLSGSGDWRFEKDFFKTNESSARYSLGVKVNVNSTSLGSFLSRDALKELRYASNCNFNEPGTQSDYLKVFDVGNFYQ